MIYVISAIFVYFITTFMVGFADGIEDYGIWERKVDYELLGGNLLMLLPLGYFVSFVLFIVGAGDIDIPAIIYLIAVIVGTFLTVVVFHVGNRFGYEWVKERENKICGGD